ncbi:MAG TPA: family 16 glycoside hydrolase [Verrucomicrobiae bacterium]|nr:family 16 glycoside hydrolase [Verrucomicrobiae bacterium]
MRTQIFARKSCCLAMAVMALSFAFASRAAENKVETGPSAPEKGFKSIFNGKDLTGWDGDPALWSVKDGAIVGQTTKEHPAEHNTFLIWTNGTVGDFEVRCDFKIFPNNNQGFANSGIQYRSKVLDKNGWVVGGYQADMEAGPNYTGILYEERMTRGIMATRGEKVVWDSKCLKRVVGSLGSPAELGAFVKKGDWNHYDVVAQGHHLRHFINGHEMVDVVDNCASKRADRGVLALQLHHGPPMTVEYRNFRLKNLAGNTSASAGDLKRMQGAWQVAGIEVGGEEAPAESVTNIEVHISGEKFKVLNLGSDAAGTFVLDSTQMPRQIEIHPESGPDAGQVWPGIYELENNSMKVCYSRIASRRPSSLQTGTDADLVLITYNRKAAE